MDKPARRMEFPRPWITIGPFQRTKIIDEPPAVCAIVSRLALLLLVLSISTQVLADTFYFSSPPRLDREESDTLFAPLADLLSRSSGESFVYVHPDSWFIYQNDMRKDRFHLLLDDAHFASWRIASLGHKPLAKVEPRIRYAVITTRNGRVYSKEDLVAHSLCAYPPPDLGTLSIIQMFDAPFRVPQGSGHARRSRRDS